MKRCVSAILLFALTLALWMAPVFAAQGGVWRILHDGANFYRDAALQEVVKTLPRNAEVELISETDGTAKVVYMGETGYVIKSNLYFTAEAVGGGEEERKVTASTLGQEIPLRKYPYADSPVLAMLTDGVSVTAAVGGVVYTGYTEVVYNGQRGFIENENLTTGLTLNGIIALTVGIVTVVLAVLVLMLLAYTKRVRSEKKRRQEQLFEEAREYGEQS